MILTVKRSLMSSMNIVIMIWAPTLAEWMSSGSYLICFISCYSLFSQNSYFSSWYRQSRYTYDTHRCNSARWWLRRAVTRVPRSVSSLAMGKRAPREVQSSYTPVFWRGCSVLYLPFSLSQVLGHLQLSFHSFSINNVIYFTILLLQGGARR